MLLASPPLAISRPGLIAAPIKLRRTAPGAARTELAARRLDRADRAGAVDQPQRRLPRHQIDFLETLRTVGSSNSRFGMPRGHDHALRIARIGEEALLDLKRRIGSAEVSDTEPRDSGV